MKRNEESERDCSKANLVQAPEQD